MNIINKIFYSFAIFLILIIGLIFCNPLITVSVASFFVEITVQVEVVSTEWLDIYGPPHYDIPIWGAQFANFYKGTTENMTFMVTNRGSDSRNVTVMTNPQIISWADISFSQDDLGILAPGSSANTTMIIHVPTTTNTGNYTFGVIFDAH